MAVIDKPFSIHLTGETSGEVWTGDFRAKTALTHRDNLIKDARYRELVGTLFGGQASPMADSIASIVSDLQVRLTEAPLWFKNSNYGLDLVDQLVLEQVYTLATKIEIDDRKEKAEKSEKARQELAKEVAPPSATK